jgi:protein TonB
MTKPTTMVCILTSIALHGGLIRWGGQMIPDKPAQLQTQQGLVAVELNLMPAISSRPEPEAIKPKSEPISPPPSSATPPPPTEKPTLSEPTQPDPPPETTPEARVFPTPTTPRETEKFEQLEPETMKPSPPAHANAPDLNAAEEPIGIQQLAKPRSAVRPVYPRLSRRRGEEGLVTITCTITENGEPKNIAIKQSSGFPLLDKAALQAIQRSRFTPAQRQGVPIRSTIEQVIEFKLEEEQ